MLTNCIVSQWPQDNGMSTNDKLVKGAVWPIQLLSMIFTHIKRDLINLFNCLVEEFLTQSEITGFQGGRGK